VRKPDVIRAHRSVAGPARSKPRAAAVGALILGAVAGACEHPLPPTGPTPRELTVAEALSVPLSTVQAFERNGVQAPASSRPPDPADPVLEQLRRMMTSLEQRYSAAPPAAP
jgi:hypothetical protein